MTRAVGGGARAATSTVLAGGDDTEKE